MPISKVYMICNAYESGFGHGVNNDGLDGDYYADPDHNEAYHIGYRAGAERSKEKIPCCPEPSKDKCNQCQEINGLHG